MWPLIFSPIKNLENYLNNYVNHPPMPTIKKTTVKKTTLPNPALPRQWSTDSQTSVWHLAAKVALTVGAFMIPLAVGTWTPDRWEIHKTLIMLAAVTVAWGSYFLGQFRHPSGHLRWHPLDWLVLSLGAAALIGTLTSVSWWTSLTGIQGIYAETLPVTLSFVSVYFLGARLFRTAADRLMVWAALLGGVGLSLLLQLFQFSGVSVWPGQLKSELLFSTLSNSSLQVALLAAVVAATGLLLWPKAKERWAQLCLAGVVTIGWLVLLFLGQTVAWAAFALGMILVVFMQASRSPVASSRIVIVAVVLAAAGMLGQFFKINTYSQLPSTAELSLSQSVSAGTALSTVAARPVLGSGPNTWYDAFVAHRPLAFNANSQWSNRYLRSGTEWSELLATTGVVGLALWLGIFLTAGWEFWRLLQRQYSFTLAAGLLAIGFMALSAALTTWSLSFLACGWFALALGRAKIGAADSAPTPNRSALPAVGFALTVILAVMVWYPAIRVYASQVFLAKSQQQINRQVPTAAITATLSTATKLDSRNIDAAILLANAQAAKIQTDLQANDITAAKQSLTDATTTMRNMVKRNPHNPAAYEAENNLLNGLASYLPDPEKQANQNFAELMKLEPTNPVHDVGFGQTLLVIRARAAANQTAPASATDQAAQLQRALQAFNDALHKKSDYLQARYARADAYLIGGQYQLALDDLNKLTVAAPNVAVFWASSGTALAKLDQHDQAKTSFEQALTIDPTDPSTYLMYGQALSDAKKTDDAKAVLDRGLKALPNDTNIQAALKKLSA